MKRAVFNPMLSVCLSVLLALTGLSASTMRAANAATGQMVICTGKGPQIIYVDSQGQPTSAPHQCADCILSFFHGPDELGPLRSENYGSLSRTGKSLAHVQLPDPQTGYWGRAPPALI